MVLNSIARETLVSSIPGIAEVSYLNWNLIEKTLSNRNHGRNITRRIQAHFMITMDIAQPGFQFSWCLRPRHVDSETFSSFRKSVVSKSHSGRDNPVGSKICVTWHLGAFFVANVGALAQLLNYVWRVVSLSSESALSDGKTMKATACIVSSQTSLTFVPLLMHRALFWPTNEK